METEKIILVNLLLTEAEVHPEELTSELLSEDSQAAEAGKTWKIICEKLAMFRSPMFCMKAMKISELSSFSTKMIWLTP